MSCARAAAPVAAGDRYPLEQDGALSVSVGTGVVANDTLNGHTVEVVLESPPSSGTLLLRPDGSFQYTPAPGVSGTVAFTYKLRTVVGPVLFTIDAAQSRLQVEARATTDYGASTDRDDSRVTGTLRARLAPGAAPFSTAQITELDARLADALDLNLRFGCLFGACLATVNVKTRAAEPDWLTLSMVEPGPQVPVVGGVFSQPDNTFALAGTADITGSGLAADLIPSGPQSLDTTASIDMADTQITSANGVLTLRAPVLYTGRFFLDPEVTTTNYIDLTARTQFTGSSGFLVATAPASANVPEESSIATVSLVIEPANPDQDQDGMDDAWELANGLDPQNPGDATTDSDGDGADNRSEFLAGTDPRQAASILAVSSLVAGPNDLELQFSGLVAGRQYQLESSESLETWTSLGAGFTASASQENRSTTVPEKPTLYRLRCLYSWP
jgi:hypothetical protein